MRQPVVGSNQCRPGAQYLVATPPEPPCHVLATSVVLGLQQPRDAMRFVAADQLGGLFQAGEDPEPGGQDVGVAMPTSRACWPRGPGPRKVSMSRTSAMP